MSGGHHNSAQGLAAKVAMRRNVLAELPAAHVLDTFCGPVGEMHRLVWQYAASYAGIDRDWLWTDARRRYVGDSLAICASLDLSRFNVFDIDAFGALWPHMLLLARRRKWAAGERGAVVTTDGSSMDTRLGRMPKSLRAFLGLTKWQAKTAEANELHRAALAEWYRRSGVKPLRSWHSTSNGSGKGRMLMHYRAIVFEGTGAAA